MELTPLPSQLPQYSRTNSDTSGSDRGTDRRRDDRRRGRLNSELLTAVLEGDLEEVAKRLEAGASVNATCRPTRTTVLQLAVACGHQQIAHLLLCRGATLGLRDLAGRQAIHLAAATGNQLLLQLLLDSDPEVINSRVIPSSTETVSNDCLDSWSHDHDAVNEKIPELSKGTTPLHIAAQRLHLDCVAELLNRGGRVDLPDERGLTPLDVIGEIPASPSVDVLVDLADALPTSDETLSRIKNMKQRISGFPSMHMRFNLPNRPKPQSTKAASIRVMEPPDVQNRMSIPDPPSPPIVMPSAFKSSDPSLVIVPSPFKTNISLAQKIASELISNGAKLPKSNLIMKQGGVQNQVTMQISCLHTAVERQDLQLIDYLLQNGACPLTWNCSGITPLHLAVNKQLLEPLKVLLEKGKSSQQVVDVRDSLGRTPLHLAVSEHWFPGVSLLLEAGADVKITSNDNQTVLHIAARHPEPRLLEELLTIPDSVKIIDSRNNQHESPLCCAVSSHQLPCVSLLLSKGADITISLPGDITLLHLATESGDKAVLDILLREPRIKTLKNIRSKEGKGGTTAVHLAALRGFTDCMDSLIAAGCDLETVTTYCPYYGSTALHLAAFKGHSKTVESIIKSNKRTLCLKNAHGWYPLHVAARFAKRDCVRYMLLNGANLAATIIDSGGYKKTALDIIVYSILHPISFLENIFDCCIEVNEYPLNNPKCVAKVKYDVLQPLGSDRKQLKVLDSLLNCGKHVVQEKLLLHPLVETFLHLKWKKLRVFFFFMMILNMVFTVSLTIMAMFFYVSKTQSTAVDTCIVTCRFTLCTSLTLLTIQELLQASRMQRYYINDLESWVKWVTFILSTIVVAGQHPAEWLRHVSTVAVLLSWLVMLFLLSRWPSSLGFYILMFFTVAKNVMKVLATFPFVILGFTFAFMIHFEAGNPFVNFWESLVKVMVMTLEFDYGDLFESIKSVNAASVVGRLVFLSFMVLVAIVLMNLLVGLAVSDIATLEKQGRAQRLAKQIDFLSLLEMFVYNRALFVCCPNKLSEAIKRCRATEPYLVVEPGKPLSKTRYILPQNLRQSVINNIINRKKKPEEESCEEDADSNDSSSESDSLPPPPSVAKSDKGEETRVVQTAADSQIKHTLDLIMDELAFIKREIENMRTQSNVRPTVYHTGEEEPLRYLRT